MVLGGGLIGCEIAEFLADRGKTVIIIEQLEQVAAEAVFTLQKIILDMLQEKGIQAITKASVDQIVERGLRITDQNLSKTRIDIDNVVLAVGSVAKHELYNALLGAVPELHSVGDCAQPRRILEAIEAGAQVGLQI